MNPCRKMTMNTNCVFSWHKSLALAWECCKHAIRHVCTIRHICASLGVGWVSIWTKFRPRPHTTQTKYGCLAKANWNGVELEKGGREVEWGHLGAGWGWTSGQTGAGMGWVGSTWWCRPDPDPPSQPAQKLHQAAWNCIGYFSGTDSSCLTGVVSMCHGVMENKSPFSKLHHDHLLPCTGYSTDQLVCLPIQHRIGLGCPSSKTGWEEYKEIRPANRHW